MSKISSVNRTLITYVYKIPRTRTLIKATGITY